MTLWIDVVGAAQASLLTAATFARSVFHSDGAGAPGPALTALLARGRGALRRAHREEKVALLGLVLVLAFLSWP